jgi:putative restriction endonuclease
MRWRTAGGRSAARFCGQRAFGRSLNGALREIAERELGQPEGQGTFRLRLLRAYRRCAITRESARPVLDAVHIQPYLGPMSNQLQNGLILTKELHTLFDAGYITITPDYAVRVSDALRADYQNGRRYFTYDKQRIHMPQDLLYRPSRAALAWHQEHVFRG